MTVDGKKSKADAQDKATKTTLASTVHPPKSALAATSAVSKKTATAKEKSLPGKGGAPGLASSSKRNNAALQATSAKTQVSNANTSSGRSSRANNDTVGKADMKKKDAKGGGSNGGRGGGGGGGKTQGKSSATMAKS